MSQLKFNYFLKILKKCMGYIMVRQDISVNNNYFINRKNIVNKPSVFARLTL